MPQLSASLSSLSAAAGTLTVQPWGPGGFPAVQMLNLGHGETTCWVLNINSIQLLAPSLRHRMDGHRGTTHEHQQSEGNQKCRVLDAEKINSESETGRRHG